MSKHGKSERGNKANKQTDVLHKVIIWLASIGIIVIVLVNVVINVYWGINGMFNKDSVESSWLNTGIGVISLAITIWAGLSISNLVSRKDIDYLKATLEKLQQTTDAEVKPFIDQSQRTIFQQFLVEMERAQDDPIAQYFVGQFREEAKRLEESEGTEESAIPYAKLMEIETLIAQVVLRHKKQIIWELGGFARFSSILCIGKAFLLRRASMYAAKLEYPAAKMQYYGTVDPEGRNIGRDTWWKNDIAIERVLAEIKRIGEYGLKGDLSIF